MPSRPTLPPLALLLGAGLVPCAPANADAQSLRGSRSSIDRMYREARAERLPFYRTSTALRAAFRHGRLVRLAPNDDVALAGVSFPYVTGAARTFVRRLGAQYRARCGERLVVTSATRPTARQPANSVARSVHPTGMAIDLRKPHGACLQWLRTTLLDLEGARLIEVTEEHAPPHFHVAVFPSAYAEYVAARSRATADDVARLAADTTSVGTSSAGDEGQP